jgi:large conductance mechanosensitive channel
MFKGFRDFILRGNVVDLAVAVIIGAAFNAIVTALVGDVLNPLIAATIGKPDFSNVIINVGNGHIKVGSFLNAVISFFIVASVVYFAIVLPLNTLQARLKKLIPEPPPPPSTRTCPECLSEIPLAAKRCAYCTQPVA